MQNDLFNDLQHDIKPIDLNNKSDRERLENLIVDDIDAYCKQLYDNDFRDHLGASELGDQCHRKLYNTFRWMKKPDFEGRMRRLFNVGHEAEPRFIKYLRGIGFEVRPFSQQLWYSSELNDYKAFDWNADLSGGTGSYEPVEDLVHFKEAEKRGIAIKQWRASGANEHYGMSLDGQCVAPARYKITEPLVFLNEFKTNNTGRKFDEVAEVDLAKSKPKHYAQMCQCGYKFKLKYGIYLIENKNDSSIIVRIIELDWNYGQALERKAEEIIFATEPPPKIAENESFFDCKYCDQFRDICHKGAKPDKNCRSCRHSVPTQNATWTCTRFNSEIPASFIRIGCDNWNPIT